MVKERGAPHAPAPTNPRASLPLTAFAKAKAKHNPTWHNAKHHAAQRQRMKRFKANKIKQKMACGTTGAELLRSAPPEVCCCCLQEDLKHINLVYAQHQSQEGGKAGPESRKQPSELPQVPGPSVQELRQARAKQRTREKKQYMKKTKKGQPLMKPRIDKILAALQAE